MVQSPHNGTLTGRRPKVRHERQGGRDVADVVLFAHEGLHILQAIEPHKRDELHFVTGVSAHQVDMTEAWDGHGFDAGDHLTPHHTFVDVGLALAQIRDDHRLRRLRGQDRRRNRPS